MMHCTGSLSILIEVNTTKEKEKKRMKKQILAAVAVLALSASSAFALTGPGAGVIGSIRDMTANGSGAVDSQGRVCAFCHTPHHAATGLAAPLWSRPTEVGQNFVPYASGTFGI